MQLHVTWFTAEKEKSFRSKDPVSRSSPCAPVSFGSSSFLHRGRMWGVAAGWRDNVDAGKIFPISLRQYLQSLPILSQSAFSLSLFVIISWCCSPCMLSWWRCSDVILKVKCFWPSGLALRTRLVPVRLAVPSGTASDTREREDAGSWEDDKHGVPVFLHPSRVPSLTLHLLSIALPCFSFFS